MATFGVIYNISELFVCHSFVRCYIIVFGSPMKSICHAMKKMILNNPTFTFIQIMHKSVAITWM